MLIVKLDNPHHIISAHSFVILLSLNFFRGSPRVVLLKEGKGKLKKPKDKVAQGGPSKRNTRNSGGHASGVSSDVDPNIKEPNCSSRSKDGKSTTRVWKKHDGGAPKDSNDIDSSERANVGGEKEIEKQVELEDDAAKQVIMSDGASCENFANGEVPATDNLTDMDQNIQKPKHGSKLENGTGMTKVPKNCDSKVWKHSVVEKQVNGEDDVVKQRVTPDHTCENFANGHGSTSGEQITGNGFGETEWVSDGASAEQLKNHDDDNKSVDEWAETGNSVGEKESDVGKQVIMSGGTSSEQIPNLYDDNQIVDETSQMGNRVGETDWVSDGSLAEPIKNHHDNKSVDEMAETGNSVGEKESDSVKQVIMSGGTSGEQIPNLHDDNQIVDENSQTGNGVSETEGVSDGTLAEPIKNRDDNKSVDETTETGNNSVAEKESDVVKQVIMYDGASGQHITNSDDDKSADEMAEMANSVCEKGLEVEGLKVIL